MLLKDVLIATSKKLLPRRIRNSLVHFSFNIARDEFDKFAFLYAYAPNMRLGLEALKQRGFSPKTIVDVGAFHGQWSQIAKAIWPQAQLAMIEPNKQQIQQLTTVSSELNAQLYCELLGAEDGKEVSFYVMDSGSSIYEERSSVNRTKEFRQIQQLDTVLHDWDSIDLLKIDAQGYELEIMKGAERLLASTKSVLLEVSLIQTNQGAPLLHDITEFMYGKGFVAYEILEFHRRPLDNALNQIDILYIYKDAEQLADKRHS